MNDDSFIIWRVAPALHVRSRDRVNEAQGQRKSSQVWDQFLSDHPDAWNGPMLQLVEADENQLIASESDYRTYVESLSSGSKDADLFLAVTGVLSTDSGFVVGFRGKKVNYPGLWEFAPAGSLERLPIREMLCREIVEELGIDCEEVDVGEPVGMYLDQETRVADVVVPVRVITPWLDVVKKFEPGEGEYARVETRDLPSLLAMLNDGSAVNDLFRQIVEWIQCGVVTPDTIS